VCGLTGGGNMMEEVDYPESELRRQVEHQRRSEAMMGESTPDARADKPPMAPGNVGSGTRRNLESNATGDIL
jgi:hypothetical protein